MTLRKFLRFFKHFPRYMAYDVRWLKNKIRQRKDNKMQIKLKKRNEAEIEKFEKVLYNIYKNAFNIDNCLRRMMIVQGNGTIYIPVNSKKLDYYKFFVRNGYVNVANKGKILKFRCDAFEDKTWREIVHDYFMEQYNPEYKTVILFRETTNRTIVRPDKNRVLIYQTYGKQPKRLRYTMKWLRLEDGSYEVSVIQSREHAEFTFTTTVDPEKFLK